MDLALGFAAFWPALALGSFLNVVAARVPLRRSVVRPASACMSCGHELAWYDNVPVASWLLLRGRCRSCGSRISPLYPAVELATAGLVAGSFVAFGPSGDALVASFFCLVLVVLSAIDLTHRIVPNRIVLPAALVVLLAQTALHPSPEWALGALGASGFLFVAALVYPAGMGMGDVKLALLLGAMLGRTVGVGVMVGMVAALVPSVVLLARHGSAARKMGIPFAPFLALGALVALFAGQQLLDAYLGTF
ncbi:MAG TPA: prepilin peptidase [Gaiellaceae bacterium]|nr:prepilin peptidase [Gaiellaceae bacterium]